jgi:hypothetical protein
MTNEDAFEVIERQKRNHNKNKNHDRGDDAQRHARISRQKALESVEDDDDWRSYIDR